jgi:hypothetical protein
VTPWRVRDPTTARLSRGLWPADWPFDRIGMSVRMRRGDRAGSEGGRRVEDFWGWWASAGRAAAEAGIGGAGFEGFTGEMTARVQAMHPDLAWELAPGGRAEHALVMRCGGDPGVAPSRRALASASPGSQRDLGIPRCPPGQPVLTSGRAGDRRPETQPGRAEVRPPCRQRPGRDRHGGLSSLVRDDAARRAQPSGLPGAGLGSGRGRRNPGGSAASRPQTHARPLESRLTG